MTAIWGPLGWITLHSVASIYPEEPTNAERQLIMAWVELFRDTITCHHCRTHFTDMYALYRQRFPGMFNSRQELMAFTFRAHNSVNRRLNKPIYNTVAECMDTLRSNLQVRTARDFRNAYLVHIRKYWRSLSSDVSGVIAMRKIDQMVHIEKDYLSVRDTNLNVELEETLVVLPRGIIEKIEPSILPSRQRQSREPSIVTPAAPVVPEATPVRPRPSVGFRITGGGLRLR